MSQLKKCLMAPVDVMLPEVTPLEADLSYPKHPIKVSDQKDRVMWHKMIKFFKVQSNDTEEEATWESEDFIHSRHPCFIFAIVRKCAIVRCSYRAATPSKSQVKISVRGVGCYTPGVTVATTVLNRVSLCTVSA
jgi:hypothetical protein